MKYLKDYGNCSGPLGFPMQEKDARELEEMLDTGEWSHCTIRKSEMDGVFPGERSDISVISDDTIDKDGDVIDPKSVSFERFRQNPVVAYNHMYDIPPIGKSLWQKLVGGNTWKAKTQYISRPETHPREAAWLPDSIFHMIQSGSMRGKSLGGAVKWRGVTEEDVATHPTWKSARRVSEKVVVYEYSACPLAVNNNTVVEEVSKAVLSLPEEIMRQDFPEAYEAIKELKKKTSSLPVIKSYVTVEEFKRKQELLLQAKVAEVKSQLPKMVEDTFKRLTGKVS